MRFLKIIIILNIFVFLLSLCGVCFAYINQANSIAYLVVGQTDTNSGDANQGGGISANGLDRPIGVNIYASKLFISDVDNNRVLIYNTIPTSNNASANVVIGQTDMTSGDDNQGGAVGANTIFSPRMAYVYNNKLFVVDRDNNRVLIFNTIPTSNNASADVVIGQPDMISNSANQGLPNPAANTLRSPRSVLVVDGKLIITDSNNHRVLIYNSIPTSNDASANIVIGQTDMVSGDENQGGAVAANTLYNPRSIAIVEGKLVISDTSNNRVLIYNSVPSSNNATANIAVGQSDFNSGLPNQGGSVSANGFNSPHGLSVDENHLFVDDLSNNRVLIFNSIPISNNASADIVIGQADMTSNTANQGGSVAANTLSGVIDSFVYGGNLYLADRDNNRILVYKLGPDFLSFSISTSPVNGSKNKVILNITSIGAYQMMISNYPDFREGVWEANSPTKEWILLGDGEQTVYAKLRDYALYESGVLSVSTNLPKSGMDNYWIYLPLMKSGFRPY